MRWIVVVGSGLEDVSGGLIEEGIAKAALALSGLPETTSVLVAMQGRESEMREVGPGCRVVGLGADSADGCWSERLRALEIDCDIVHAHGASGLRAGLVLARDFGVPLICSPHLSEGEGAGSANDAAWGEADALVAAWPDEQAALTAAGSGRVSLIAPGLEPREEVRPNEAALAPCRTVFTDEVALERVREALAQPSVHSSCGEVETAPLCGIERAGRGSEAAAAPESGLVIACATTHPGERALIEAARRGVPALIGDSPRGRAVANLLGHGEVVALDRPDTLAEAIVQGLTDGAWRAGHAAAGIAKARELTWIAHADALAALGRRLAGARDDAAPGEGLAGLLLSSLDAALTGDRKAAARFARWRAARRDWGFVVSTGRSLAEAIDVLRFWSLPMPDAVISSMGTRIDVWSREAQTYVGDAGYAAMLDASWDGAAIDAALDGGDQYEPWVENEDDNLPRRRYMSRQAAAYRIITERIRQAGLCARVIVSVDGTVDVLPSCAGKDVALRRLSRHFQVPLRDCIAVGVSAKDYDFVNGAMKAIMVGNHCETLAPLAAMPHVYVARRKFADGILEGLAKFVLQGEGTPI